MAGFEVPADTAGQPERFRTGTFIMPAFRLTEEQAETPEEGGIDAMFDNCAASDLLRSEPRRPEIATASARIATTCEKAWVRHAHLWVKSGDKKGGG